MLVALYWDSYFDAVPNKAVILNDLGIVYSQCDRHVEALRAFREAEAICLQMDEGPSLASLYSNMAVLQAKLGDFEDMERSLEGGEKLGPAALGLRQRFILDHARGLCLVLAGRHSEARRYLEAATSAAQALGERYLVHFERVYRVEALIFEASYGVVPGKAEPSSGDIAAKLKQFDEATLRQRRRQQRETESGGAKAETKERSRLEARGSLHAWQLSLTRISSSIASTQGSQESRRSQLTYYGAGSRRMTFGFRVRRSSNSWRPYLGP